MNKDIERLNYLSSFLSTPTMAEVQEKSNILALDIIAKQLLRERFVLTALELHAETTEAGQEIPYLRDYFSNPSNFELCSKSSADLTTLSANLNRSSSQTTLDSLDWARFSEDGERVLDDRIAVLEFELRKAKETIQGLRDNLTQATAAASDNENFALLGNRKSSMDTQPGDLKPHEVCTLNFLINEYLVMRNYKMTANTFADENENQDFENWDDVGLNIPRPPTLIQWLQEKVPAIAPKSFSECQTNIDALQMESLLDSKERVKFLEERVKELESLCERQELELQKLQRKMSSPQIMPLENLPSKEIDTAAFDAEEENERAAEREKNDVDGNEEKMEEEYSVDVALQGKPEPYEHAEYLLDGNDVGIESIEDFIENPSSSNVDDGITSSMETLSTRKTLDYPDDIVESKENIVVTPTQDLDTEFDEERDTHEIYPETSEALDPLKCDRLPPLGASSECSPQGVLVGEFISAQRDEARNLLNASTSRKVPQFLEMQIMNVCLDQTLGVDSRLQNEVAALSLGQCDLLNLVSSSLHNIAPNVILSKREELLPLLVYSISQHADSSERERLLHLLFNLTKKPEKEQRSTILLGLVNLARVLGPDKLEAELLPQCWEQLSHKHTERRLLVAQSVAVLSPYTPPPLRNSLLLSMLQQLLGPGGEKEPIVREAAMASLSLLISYLDDVEKIPPLMNNLILCLQRLESRNESNQAKKQSTVFLLLSSLAYWAVKSGRFESFTNPLLEQIKLISSDIKNEIAEENKKSKIEQLSNSLNSLVKGLSASVPYLFLYLLDSVEGSEVECVSNNVKCSFFSSDNNLAFIDELSVILGSREKAESSLAVIHSRVSSVNKDSWPELKYVVSTFLPQILDALSFLDASMKSVIVSFVNVVSRLCLSLGVQGRRDILSPLFLEALQAKDSNLEIVTDVTSNLTKAPLVVHIVGILSEEIVEGGLQKFLSQQISALALSRASMQSLQLAILLLVERSQCLEEVLGALWASLVHQSPLVRTSTATLWVLLVGHIREAELASRVVPALVTLATDPDITVRASVIMPLAFVIANSSCKEVKDKALLQLESVCEEAQVLESPPLQIAIAQTCASLGHNTPSHLLHQLFLPCLCRVALEGSGTPQEKFMFGTALLEALTALASSPMPDHLVAHFILPPLNQLQKTLGVMSYEHMETITVLTKEYTLRAQASSSSEKIRTSLSTSGLSNLGNSLSNSMGAMGAGLPIGSGVEDVKNKMSKMFSSTGRSVSSGFQGKGPSLNLPTLFKKK